MPSLDRSEIRMQSRHARLKRLAARIDELSTKDEAFERHVQEVADLRRAAAAELHGICAAFTGSVNELLSHDRLELDPPAFNPEFFQEDAPNLFQINARGRVLQIAFEAPTELVSSEDFRIPYILAGSLRAFNQELLDKDLIEEQLLFYTTEKNKKMWRFFDARTYRTGPFDEDYLVSLMEQLI